jgi:3-hydroxy-5-methyl-1-naphthoate 3-O-methyltransferase
MPIPELSVRPTTDPTRAYRYRDGIVAADLITTAIVHFDFFTWLAAHPSSETTIARELGMARRPLDVLLTLSAANGFVAREGDVFVVTGVAREHLVAGSPFNLAPYYASFKDRAMVRELTDVLRTGKPGNWGGDKDGFDWHRAMEDDAFARQFTAAMDCRGHYLAHALADALQLRGSERILDIGGGSGIYSCILAARHPGLRATVFDQAPVDRIAAKLINERGCERQVSVHAGSFFRDQWPADHNTHLVSNVLHDWDVPEVRALLARSFEALPAGGLLIIHDAFINADKTGPLAVAEYSAILMHATQGKCYSTAEYAEMLAEAGFGGVWHADTVVDRGVMTARKP